VLVGKRVYEAGRKTHFHGTPVLDFLLFVETGIHVREIRVNLLVMLPAVSHTLHESGFYQIRDFKCNCVECHRSKPEYSKSFNLCFVRSGYFEFEVFRRNLEVHVGRVLISKPGSEHIARHIDDQPDVCSVFDFKSEFYKSLIEHYRYEIPWFFDNNDVHSLLLKCGPELDYLHDRILRLAAPGAAQQIQIDDLVLRLVHSAMSTLGNIAELPPIASTLKKFHLGTIEKARNFMLANFDKNIGLQELAEHCCVSLFHFSRIFKAIMKVSPHMYLSDIRLNHARLLLENTKYPITQIAIQCGFNSVEHFATAYKQRFVRTPTETRTSVKSF
jgi:AraC-like DNA-binding protein